MEEKYGCPAKYGVWSRGSAGIMFLACAPIFRCWGLSRGPTGELLLEKESTNQSKSILIQ